MGSGPCIPATLSREIIGKKREKTARVSRPVKLSCDLDLMFPSAKSTRLYSGQCTVSKLRLISPRMRRPPEWRDVAMDYFASSVQLLPTVDQIIADERAEEVARLW